LCPHLFDDAVYVRPYARKARKVRGRHLLGLGTADLQTLSQTEIGHAVKQSEVHGLGDSALISIGAHACRNVEDLASGKVVDVRAIVESASHRFVSREMGHKPQLDLAVVRG